MRFIILPVGRWYKGRRLTFSSNRLHRSDPEFERVSSREYVEENPYVSPEEMVQVLVEEDDDLSLYAVRLTYLP